MRAGPVSLGLLSFQEMPGFYVKFPDFETLSQQGGSQTKYTRDHQLAASGSGPERKVVMGVGTRGSETMDPILCAALHWGQDLAHGQCLVNPCSADEAGSLGFIWRVGEAEV